MSKTSTNHYTTLSADEKNRLNQAKSNPGLLRIFNIFANLLVREKAEITFKLFPYLRPEYQSMRGLASILQVSHQTVANWKKEYGGGK